MMKPHPFRWGFLFGMCQTCLNAKPNKKENERGELGFIHFTEKLGSYNNPCALTLAENWLKSTDSPFFIFAKSLDNKVIEEKI